MKPNQPGFSYLTVCFRRKLMLLDASFSENCWCWVTMPDVWEVHGSVGCCPRHGQVPDPKLAPLGHCSSCSTGMRALRPPDTVIPAMPSTPSPTACSAPHTGRSKAARSGLSSGVQGWEVWRNCWATWMETNAIRLTVLLFLVFWFPAEQKLA